MNWFDAERIKELEQRVKVLEEKVKLISNVQILHTDIIKKIEKGELKCRNQYLKTKKKLENF